MLILMSKGYNQSDIAKELHTTRRTVLRDVAELNHWIKIRNGSNIQIICRSMNDYTTIKFQLLLVFFCLVSSFVLQHVIINIGGIDVEVQTND